MSLRGRLALNQYKGAVIVRSVASTARRVARGAGSIRRIDSTSANAASAAGDDAQQAERAGLRGDQRVHSLGRQNIQRVTGRMRLMPGDVEITHAEGEVDRIEIFEGGGGERQVEREKRGGEQAGDRPW